MYPACLWILSWQCSLCNALIVINDVVAPVSTIARIFVLLTDVDIEIRDGECILSRAVPSLAPANSFLNDNDEQNDLLYYRYNIWIDSTIAIVFSVAMNQIFQVI